MHQFKNLILDKFLLTNLYEIIFFQLLKFI
jgi:hypothetical protein